MITHLKSDILEYEVKWDLGNITTNKASGGDGIPAELFQILKDGAVNMLQSIRQQIWKTAVAMLQKSDCWNQAPLGGLEKSGFLSQLSQMS